MCKILFIKPSMGRFKSAVAPPLGVLYISSYLKSKLNNSVEIKVVDMRVEDGSFKLTDVLKKYNPDIAGITACSEEDVKVHQIAKEIKLYNRNILVVVGGPHATMYYEQILKDENIDLCVIGEGEVTFYEIVKKYMNKDNFYDITGIAWRNNLKKIVFTGNREFIDNLDILPFPEWDLIKIKSYSSPMKLNMNVLLCGKKYMGIVTSRGCPYRCIYCHNIFGKQFRVRSPENVVQEIDTLVRKYNIDEFHIYDDIFNLDHLRLEKFCDLIISSGLKIKFAFPNGLRGDILTKQQILKLKRAGAYMLTFALETASERLQKMIKKYINKNKLLENIIFADKIGLLTKCYFMLGFPTETIEEMMRTINFACISPLCFASFFVVTPQKNTELYDLVRWKYPQFELDFETSYNYYLANKSYEEALTVPLHKIQRYAYRKFYLSNGRIFKTLLKIPRKEFVFYNFFKFISYF